MISVLAPILGRRDGVRRMLDSIDRCTEGEYEVLLGVDASEAEAWIDEGGPAEVVIFPDGTGSSVKTHDLAAMCSGDIMRIGCNDEEWVTVGWDTVLRERFAADPFWCLYANSLDGELGESRVPIVTREWYDVAGYYPRHFFHFWADQWVTTVAQLAGRLAHAPEVSIVHHHPKHGLGRMDEIYERRKAFGKQRNIWVATDRERRQLAGMVVDAARAYSG